MKPDDYRKEFLKIFDSIGRHHSRYERFADFLELATCAIRKTTVPPGPSDTTHGIESVIEAEHFYRTGQTHTDDQVLLTAYYRR